MTDLAVYEWRIVLMHERNSFTKTLQPEAPYIHEAIDKAFKAIESGGYTADEFVTVSAVRGRRI